jgi:hypothetical protein
VVASGTSQSVERIGRPSNLSATAPNLPDYDRDHNFTPTGVQAEHRVSQPLPVRGQRVRRRFASGTL